SDSGKEASAQSEYQTVLEVMPSKNDRERTGKDMITATETVRTGSFVDVEAREKARIAAEEKAKADAEAKERERIATEEKAREKARIAAKEKARAEAEAREKARVAAEEKARSEAELKENARIAVEEKVNAEAEERERARIAAEEKAKSDAEAKERERIAAEEKARAEAEAREKVRITSEEKSKADAEAKERERIAAEEKDEPDVDVEEKSLIEATEKAKSKEIAATRNSIQKKMKEADTQSKVNKYLVEPKPIAKLLIDKNRFTPDGDGDNDTVLLKPSVEGIEEISSWSILISDNRGNPFRVFMGEGEMPSEIIWDGSSDTGDSADSLARYLVRLLVEPSKKEKDRTGANYLTDSEYVRTGVLVQSVADEEWKIIVNTIYFDPDKATFKTLSKEQIDSNNETIKSVAEQLLAHPDVLVIIEGYANNVSNTHREDVEELIPLSTDRAIAIKNKLVELGVSADVITAVGKGGANPIAAWEDRPNWWKNRRVEFIMRKK
ncbi:MAG: OmpA family protein, partial [Treponema sp.]|nr:OmpA family protein [Treponema sp.]